MKARSRTEISGSEFITILAFRAEPGRVGLQALRIVWMPVVAPHKISSRRLNRKTWLGHTNSVGNCLRTRRAADSVHWRHPRSTWDALSGFLRKTKAVGHHVNAEATRADNLIDRAKDTWEVRVGTIAGLTAAALKPEARFATAAMADEGQSHAVRRQRQASFARRSIP